MHELRKEFREEIPHVVRSGMLDDSEHGQGQHTKAINRAEFHRETLFQVRVLPS